MRDDETPGIVNAALAKHGAQMRRDRSHAWNVRFRNGVGFDATVRWQDGWVEMAAELPVPYRLELASVLGLNAGLPGGARVALADRDSLQLRVDARAGDGERLSRRLHQGCRGLKQGVAAWDARLGGKPEGSRARGSGHGDGRVSFEEIDDGELAAACAASGWRANPRASGEIVFDLAVEPEFAQATVGPCASGIRIATGVDAGGDEAASGREALSLLLLRLAGATRMVRPTLVTDGGSTTASLEVVYGSLPEADEIADGLAALSVAYRRCAREASLLLRSEVAARAYLATLPTGGAGDSAGRGRIDSFSNQPAEVPPQA